MNILNTNKLNWENSISLKNNSSNKNERLKQIEQQAKVSLRNTPAIEIKGNSSVDPSKIKVKSTDEMSHFDFIKEIEELSSEEKTNISRLIQQSVKKPSGGTGDYFIMDRAQTSAQLQLIADKLIPEKFKDQMNQAIKNYQEEGYNFQVKIYEAAQAHMDKLREKFPSLGGKSIMTNGIKVLDEQEKMIYGLYSELDYSNQSNFVKSFESILTKFKENQLELKNSPDHALRQFQDELRTKWNDFATLLKDSKVSKLPTVENSLIDIRL